MADRRVLRERRRQRYYVTRKGMQYHVMCGDAPRSLFSSLISHRAQLVASEFQQAYHEGLCSQVGLP